MASSPLAIRRYQARDREISQRLIQRAFDLVDEARVGLTAADPAMADRMDAVEQLLARATTALGRLESHDDYLIAGYLLGRVDSLIPSLREALAAG